MAINVDEVYKTVLSILNKEQRGYITPDEFNKIGTQVQLEIFEKYFEDLNQQLRVPLQAAQMDDDYANRIKSIEEKIQSFQTNETLSYAPLPQPGKFYLPTDKPLIHRLGSLQYEPIGYNPVEVQRLTQHEFSIASRSSLTAPTKSFPVYKEQGDLYQVYPSDIQNDIKAYYVKKPNNTRWGYTIGSVGQYLYDSTYYTATGLPTQPNYLFNSLTTNFTATAGPPAATSFPGLTASSPGVTYVGSGTGLVFNLTMDATGLITDLTVTSSGSGYASGDTITLDDNIFQAAGPPGGTDALIKLTASSIYSGTTYGSTQFEIDSIDQTELILNILKYCGIVIRDPQIIQSASQVAMAEDQNEKM